MSEVSPGEIGGIFAGAVALAATFGHGIKWLLGFTSAQQASRQLKLQQWHDELAAKEAQLDAEADAYKTKIENRLAGLEEAQGVILSVCHALAAGLRTIDPANPALGIYDQMLRKAFRVDPTTPAAMIATLNEIDRAATAPASGGE